MEFLKAFLTNLVIFLLLIVVIDLLVPQNTFRKYTKLVIGLLFVSMMLSPIMELFKADFTEVIETGLTALFENEQYSFADELESKKSEINLSNRAYILEQMALGLKDDANEELIASFQYRIVDIVIRLDDEFNELTLDAIEQISVVLTPSEATDETNGGVVIDVAPVEVAPVRTSDHQMNGREATKEEKKMNDWLSKRWGVDEPLIDVEIQS